MTVRSEIITYILEHFDQPYVQIQSGLRIQVLPDYDALPYCQRGQSAAFVSERRVLVVWHDNAKLLLDLAQQIRDSVAESFSGEELADGERNNSKGFSSLLVLQDLEENEKNVPESGVEKPRKIMLWQAGYTATALFLSVASIGAGWSKIAVEQIQEPNWFRLLFVICIPAQFWLAQVRSIIHHKQLC
jgi:hypothetical protein